jgi:hypothetical protein
MHELKRNKNINPQKDNLNRKIGASKKRSENHSCAKKKKTWQLIVHRSFEDTKKNLLRLSQVGDKARA